ncbi:class C sortase [Leucobacter zeae]|nr:class C sortase [Leucobacter zeae]
MTTIIEERASDVPRAAASPHARRRWRFPRAAFLVSALALVGLLVVLYPSVAAWFSQYRQSQLIVSVTGGEHAVDAPELAAEVERAREYNSRLVGGALLEANANKPSADSSAAAGAEYDGLLRASNSGVMGRLRIPAIDVDLPIYHGTSDATLAKGVGHLEGTSLPVGGESQRSVLTAHRGLPEATLFDHLDRVERDDTFTIEVFGEVLTYRVTETRVIDPEDTDTLRVAAGEDLVTLVTCTPLGINTHRILVTGERITPTPAADLDRAGRAPEIPGFPWWAVGIGGSLLLLGGYVWRAGRPAPLREPERGGSGGGDPQPDPETDP